MGHNVNAYTVGNTMYSMSMHIDLESLKQPIASKILSNRLSR